MSNENWTKGKWVVKQGHYPSIVNVDCGGRMDIRIVVDATNLDFQDTQERQANANLIAAAPELYEALKQVLEDDNLLDYVQTETLYRCEKALAKARGEL